MASAEINGFYFSAADIALPNGDGGSQAFRITIAPYKPKLAFE